MTFVTCIGCNQNCTLDTEDDNIFYDDGTEYDCTCYCPCASEYVRVDPDELQKAHDDDQCESTYDSYDEELE